jgi:hypothetical protein
VIYHELLQSRREDQARAAVSKEILKRCQTNYKRCPHCTAKNGTNKQRKKLK